MLLITERGEQREVNIQSNTRPLMVAVVDPPLNDIFTNATSLDTLHCCQASELGLLSKLEKAGLTLKDVEKLLPLGGQI